MESIMSLQYGWVRGSREVLLQYCETIAAADFCQENSSFGRGSIRNLLVHIANTYELWLGEQALRKEMIFTPYEAVQNVKDARLLFQELDKLVEEFVVSFGRNYLTNLEVTINDRNAKANPLKLFTHVITHEYHHKGQILSLSRHLGYVPIDTDIMR
ncbi:DinB family protein [Pontibacter ramchanderi]|uniref:Putative damage-inducible protein DinB n=1 Tax=Pontibacter ramchanderi TaxID=1179743 RepID=A0A2N3U6U9_9BACT|nr:DinB family protein [Pontibacter ramchanderi]PKV62472.1 putative damage-inducible protein DinB [Pontibacter ramchanderi]